MEARDLVPGDAGERVQRGAQDFLDIERTADGLGDGVEDLEMRRDVGPAARRPAAALSPRRGATGAPLQALIPRAPAPWPGDHRTLRLCRGAARSREDDHRRPQACRRRRRWRPRMAVSASTPLVAASTAYPSVAKYSVRTSRMGASSSTTKILPRGIVFPILTQGRPSSRGACQMGVNQL